MSRGEFQAVVDRLRLVLDCPTETAVGAKLGFTQSTWATRKMRGSIPRKEIDALIQREHLNAEFIYNGTGDVYLPEDGETWHDRYAKRAKLHDMDSEWLFSRGHAKKVIEATRSPKPGTQPFQVLALLHDWSQLHGIDLNWLLGVDRKRAPTASDLTPDEAALISAFRSAPAAERELMLRMLGLKGGRRPSPPVEAYSLAGGANYLVHEPPPPPLFPAAAAASSDPDRVPKQ